MLLKYHGKEEYEYHVSLDEDNTMRLLVQLRMKYGVEVKLESIFNEEFGQKMPSCNLMDFCKEKSIQYDFTSY